MKRLYQGFVVAAYAILLSGPIISCSSERNGVDIPAYPPPPSPGRPDAGAGADGSDLGSGGGVSDSAEIRMAFAESQLATYVDLNASLTYEFKYLTHEKRNNVTFQNGRAELVFANLSVGQTGTLSLAMAENGRRALAGEVPNLRLDGGRNEVIITLRQIDGGSGGDSDDGTDGDDLAELVLQVVIEGSGQTGGGDVGGGGNGNADQGDGDTAFAEIQPLAKAACTGCHHSDPETEAWWTGATEKTTAQLMRSLDGSGGQPMPPPGTRQAASLTAAEKNKLLSFVSR